VNDDRPATPRRAPEAPEASKRATEVCPRCAESTDLALVKGCLRCLTCGFKWDCNGW
jgi:ribosomal protein L37AE/L43A